MATRTTRAHRHVGVQLGRCPTGVALVTGRAIGCGGYMTRPLARRTAAIVATGAVGSRGKGTVIRLGAFPFAGRLVATFAARRGGQMATVLATCNRPVVTTRTTRAHSHIGMQLGRRPTGVALVTGRAIGCGGYMTRPLARRTAAIVATGAVGSRGKGTVIRLGAFPFAGRLVATFAARRGGQMATVLATCNRPVVTTRTTRAHSHIGMQLGRRPTGVALVTGRAIGTGTDMVSVFASGFGAIVATGTNGG